MSYAIPVHVGLVDKTGKIDAATLTEVAGALNEQVQADFAPAWHVRATVGYYLSPPAGTWTIQLVKSLSDPSALGYHTDSDKQPVAYVDAIDDQSRVDPDWTITASHELLEMLADPWGNRLHSAKHLDGRAHDGRVRYLLEVCDPCEATSYEVGGVAVSDFILPAYYRSTRSGLHPKLSYAGAITEPQEVDEGGYISFVDGRGNWWQRFVEDGEVRDTELGSDTSKFNSLREFTDHHARLERAE